MKLTTELNVAPSYESWDVFIHLYKGHAVVQLVEALRYKVAGSILDGVIGIFH